MKKIIVCNSCSWYAPCKWVVETNEKPISVHYQEKYDYVENECLHYSMANTINIDVEYLEE